MLYSTAPSQPADQDDIGIPVASYRFKNLTSEQSSRIPLNFKHVLSIENVSRPCFAVKSHARTIGIRTAAIKFLIPYTRHDPAGFRLSTPSELPFVQYRLRPPQARPFSWPWLHSLPFLPSEPHSTVGLCDRISASTRSLDRAPHLP